MQLYLGDSYQIISQIPDKSVDLVITDPPYTLVNHGGSGAFGFKKRAYHNEVDALCVGISNRMIDELVRVCKLPNLYFFASKDQLPQYLNYAVEHKLNFDVLTWHKTNPVPTCNNKYLSDTEYIVFIRKGANVYGSYSTKHKYFITKCNKEDKSKYHHPTIKPLDIVKTLITNSSLKGDVVLDVFMGTGTTGVACRDLERDFIGIEINSEYFKTAEKRINSRELVQKELFESVV